MKKYDITNSSSNNVKLDKQSYKIPLLKKIKLILFEKKSVKI